MYRIQLQLFYRNFFCNKTPFLEYLLQSKCIDSTLSSSKQTQECMQPKACKPINMQRLMNSSVTLRWHIPFVVVHLNNIQAAIITSGPTTMRLHAVVPITNFLRVHRMQRLFTRQSCIQYSCRVISFAILKMTYYFLLLKSFVLLGIFVWLLYSAFDKLTCNRYRY